MSNLDAIRSPVIRRLCDADRDAITDHFVRLDRETRRARFFGAVKDAYLRRYGNTIFDDGSIVFGAIFGGQVRAVAELHVLPFSSPVTAELALSVEADWQNIGIGDALLDRLIGAAHARGIPALRLIYLPENHRMQHLAAKHGVRLVHGTGIVDAALDLTRPA